MTDEREIDLLELIAEVLKHWKGMVLFMLIGAIAGGVFDYAKANYNAEKVVEMTYAEKKAVDIALEYEKLYVEAKDNDDAENLILLNRTVIDLVKSFNDMQLEYFNDNSISELWKETKQDIIKKEDNTTIGISPKMVVIGAVAFAFIYCMIWALKYIFDGNIKISDDLHQLINADLIGSVITVKEPSFVIDKLIYRLKHHAVGKVLPVEDSLELIASVISVNAKNGEINEVAFAGCELKKKAYEYCERLATILKDSHGLDSKIIGDIVYNKDDVETLADEKGIVLIETAGASAYSDIQKEMQLINQLSINVIGGVIVE
ncbi:MAG: hypothetical protein PUK76_13680 [Treponema sp.]|nr:hypothetical protein [Treponema sp.]